MKGQSRVQRPLGERNRSRGEGQGWIRSREAPATLSVEDSTVPPPPPLPRRTYPTLAFSNFCPFEVMRLENLPNPQAYTRQERYLARPPMVLNPSGFHNENSLAVYQGLVYYLLWLHSKYDKVGATQGKPA